MYKDLREFIELVDKLGALRRIEGADPRFEIGAVTEVAAGRSDAPALLFDAIKGFPRGFRIFTNATTSPQRAALALGIRSEIAAARRAQGLDGEAQDIAAACARRGQGRRLSATLDQGQGP